MDYIVRIPRDDKAALMAAVADIEQCEAYLHESALNTLSRVAADISQQADNQDTPGDRAEQIAQAAEAGQVLLADLMPLTVSEFGNVSRLVHDLLVERLVEKGAPREEALLMVGIAEEYLAFQTAVKEGLSCAPPQQP